MAKNKKKKKQTLPEAPRTPKKPVNYRRILYLAFCFLISMTVYQVAVQMVFIHIAMVYAILATALLVTYMFINRGFDKLTLPLNPTEEERADYERRVLWGKRILGVFFAVLLTLIVDLVDLFLLDYLKDLLTK